MAARQQPRRGGLARPAPEPSPGVITRVAPTQRDPERVSIHIDGRFAFVLPALVVLEQQIVVGQELDTAAVAALVELSEHERATEAALTFVGYRPRSEREVRDRLRGRGFSADAIDAAIGRLRGWRYLDDEAFATYWVENRIEHAPRGRRRLEAELRAKGVDRSVVGEVLDEADLGEHQAALALARKRLGSLRGLDEPTQRRRLGGFLARRGYDWSVINGVFSTLFGPHADIEPDE